MRMGSERTPVGRMKVNQTRYVADTCDPTRILTISSLESHRTTASETVDTVHTCTSVLAWVAETFVYIWNTDEKITWFQNNLFQSKEAGDTTLIRIITISVLLINTTRFLNNIKESRTILIWFHKLYIQYYKWTLEIWPWTPMIRATLVGSQIWASVPRRVCVILCMS